MQTQSKNIPTCVVCAPAFFLSLSVVKITSYSKSIAKIFLLKKRRMRILAYFFLAGKLNTVKPMLTRKPLSPKNWRNTLAEKIYFFTSRINFRQFRFHSIFLALAIWKEISLKHWIPRRFTKEQKTDVPSF